VILKERAAEDWMNPSERYPLRLKSRWYQIETITSFLSAASALVNNLNNDGPELLVPDRTIPVQGSLF
jgi:putative SOS response-associated peptidase YedK